MVNRAVSVEEEYPSHECNVYWLVLLFPTAARATMVSLLIPQTGNPCQGPLGSDPLAQAITGGARFVCGIVTESKTSS